jgi:thymidylate synthase (FAD)
MEKSMTTELVRLIGVTQPRIGNDVIRSMMSASDLIAYCARVSNPKNQDNAATAAKLLSYCIRNKHWSPFEMINVVMELNTTRDIARQILRHRSFSFQEFSQRYADPSQLGFEVREARLQDPKNRQNSLETTNTDLKHVWYMKQQQIIHELNLAYKWAIENGIAKEQARAVLPEGLTKSRLYMNGNLRSWITYVAIREGNGTQKEHIEIAKECKKILLAEFAFLKDSLGDVDDAWQNIIEAPLEEVAEK